MDGQTGHTLASYSDDRQTSLIEEILRLFPHNPWVVFSAKV
jgi:hypothetical protein